MREVAIFAQQSAGALATVGYGTALGVLRSARAKGKRLRVIATESRPVLQGARLTAFELIADGFDVTVLSDTAVGSAMQNCMVDAVIVGADRITKDGYVFNKIGTYQIAALAKRHRVPFYVAAPLSSFDFERTHAQVEIEQRGAEEVTTLRGTRIAANHVAAFNPAFDCTPPSLVTAIVCERGVLRPLYPPKIKRLARAATKSRRIGPVA